MTGSGLALACFVVLALLAALAWEHARIGVLECAADSQYSLKECRAK